MGYAYEDYCQDAYERERVDYPLSISEYNQQSKINSLQYWIHAINEDLRNPKVEIEHIDWMFGQLYAYMDQDFPEGDLQIIRTPQLAQVK